MTKALAYAALEAGTPLVPWSFERRTLRPHDALIEILFCGVCHTDLHYVSGEWDATYPLVPGHEISGRVLKTGEHVTRFKEGDLAAVGAMVDSCRHCEACSRGLEQYCLNGMTGTYNDVDRVSGKPTYGGYSNVIIVDENFVLKIPPELKPEEAAPILCAGVTTYSPLRHWKIGAGHKVGIVGLGGLGHMGVMLAAALGAEVMVFTTTEWKLKDASRLGAAGAVLSTDAASMNKQAGRFDLIIDTIPQIHDVNPYLELLKRDGTMVVLGAFGALEPGVDTNSLAFRRRSLAGSIIGGIPETQEVLEFCARHNIAPKIEVIPIQQTNAAFERISNRDVRYRFVIDMASLKS